MSNSMSRKAFFKTKKTFTQMLAEQQIPQDYICYIADSQEIYTHGSFFGMSKDVADKVATMDAKVKDLDAAVYFSKFSDGVNAFQTEAKNGTIVVKGAGKTSVTASAQGLVINTPAATVAPGTSDGQVKVDGQDVSVTGWNKLGTAAFTQSSAYATAAQGTKADNAVPKTTTVNGHALTGNINVTAADLGLGNVTNESKATMFANPVFTGNPTAPTPAASDNDTTIATTAFVQTAINNKLAASDVMIFKGTLGTGGTATTLPSSTAKTGHAYKVITAGTYANQKCEVGDMIVAVTNGSSSKAAEWIVIQGNVDGVVTGPTSAVANRVVVFDGATGKLVKDSGFTIGASVPSNAKFTDTTYATMSGASGSAAGKGGLVPAPGAGSQNSFLRGDGTWAAPDKLAYSFANGADGSFTVTPSVGGAQKITIGKPATAGTADKVVNSIVVKLNGGASENTNMFTFNGTAAKTINITAASVGAAPSVHNHNSNSIVAMTGYTKPAEATHIQATDSLNTAIGKLEAANGWLEYN